MSKIKSEKEKWEIRCAEAELALENCAKAFELIPVWALERQQNWIPSETAIHLIKVAKDSVRDYGYLHWKGNNGA